MIFEDVRTFIIKSKQLKSIMPQPEKRRSDGLAIRSWTKASFILFRQCPGNRL
jgi:hypothetical protein